MKSELYLIENNNADRTEDTFVNLSGKNKSKGKDKSQEC